MPVIYDPPRRSHRLLKCPQADASPTQPPSDDIESLEALLTQLGTTGSDGLPGPESEEELQQFLETMMSQLMSKDILYDPLKELHAKVGWAMGFSPNSCLLLDLQFPGYLKDNASTLSESDRKRYESQAMHVSQIIAIFDDPKYSEEDVESSAKIVNIMSEVSATSFQFIFLTRARTNDHRGCAFLRRYNPSVPRLLKLWAPCLRDSLLGPTDCRRFLTTASSPEEFPEDPSSVPCHDKDKVLHFRPVVGGWVGWYE